MSERDDHDEADVTTKPMKPANAGSPIITMTTAAAAVPPKPEKTKKPKPSLVSAYQHAGEAVPGTSPKAVRDDHLNNKIWQFYLSHTENFTQV